MVKIKLVIIRYFDRSFWNWLVFCQIALFFVFDSYSQSNIPPSQEYKALYESGDFEKAISLALVEVEKGGDLNYSNERAELFKDIGFMYGQMGNYIKSAEFLNLAIDELIDSPSADLNLLALCHNDLAYAYDMTGYFNRCIYHYEKAYELWSNNFFDNYSYMTTVLNNLRDAHLQYGDLQRAKFYLDKLTEYQVYLNEMVSDDRPILIYHTVQFLFNKITFYEANNDLKNTLESWNEMEKFYPEVRKFQLSNLNVHFQTALESIGSLYRRLENNEAALSYYEKMKLFEMNSFHEMKYHAYKAITFYYNKNWTESLLNCDRALVFFENEKFGSSELILKTLRAELLFRIGETKKSQMLIAEVFSIWTESDIDFKDLAHLEISRLQGKNSYNYIDILIKNGNTLFEMAGLSGDPNLAHTSFHLYRLAGKTFENYYLKGAFNPSLERKHDEISEGLLKVMKKYPDLSQIHLIETINLIEGNASQQYLKEFISKNEQNLSGDFKKLKRKNELVIELAFIDQYSEEKTENEIEELKKEIAKIDKELMEKNKAKVFLGLDQFDLTAIQRRLSENEAILKYYLLEEAAYLLYIENQKLELYLLAPKASIENLMQDLKEVLKDPKKQHSQVASEALEVLIPKSLQPEKSRLYIVPDKTISYLPFEILIDQTGKMLLESHAISYLQSLKLFLLAGEEFEFKPNNFLLSYAPDYGAGKYSNIKNNQKEALAVAQMFSGDIFLGSSASKQNFIGNITNYKIHHLALHAEQDEATFENSSLVFSDDEKLFFHELYSLNFPADLVVLSACNTGIGSLEPGIGLMGLGKALTYAGAKSTLYSLWEVPDKETNHLMNFFYAYLKKGKPKDEALRLAKLDFVTSYPLKSHPYFWAGFVLSGNPEPITNGNRHSLFYILSFLIIIFLIFYIMVKKQNRSISNP